MESGGGGPVVALDAQSINELDAQIEQLLKCQVRCGRVVWRRAAAEREGAARRSARASGGRRAARAAAAHPISLSLPPSLTRVV